MTFFKNAIECLQAAFNFGCVFEENRGKCFGDFLATFPKIWKEATVWISEKHPAHNYLTDGGIVTGEKRKKTRNYFKNLILIKSDRLQHCRTDEMLSLKELRLAGICNFF